MKVKNPIKCWIVSNKIIDTAAISKRPVDFEILKKSILKLGYRGYFTGERAAIEKDVWYQNFLLGYEVRVYIDGSGIYKIANIDLSENEVYFERLRIPVGYRPWIFYSWQSDLMTVNHEIEAVLREVIQDINKTRNPKAELKLVNTNEDQTGSANIVEEIKKNIDRSLVFIADVTNVAVVKQENGTELEKWHPNSNAIFELSYASVKKTADQVLMVKRIRGNGIENKSPFDIYQNLHIPYTTKTELKKSLGSALALSLERIGFIA